MSREPLTDDQIRETIQNMRATDVEKAALRKQALEHRDPNALFAVYGLRLRQQRMGVTR